MTHPEIDPAAEARRALEASLYECKRVVVGQDAMLERLLVALLTGGHVLLEGVPGLAKTLTVRTLATVLGGTFRRIQFTPDLVPADLVGTRIWQPGNGTFRTELGPVFANLLLADEINRAPAKVQSALLEVMQEHQVTIGGETHRVPEPYLVLATQNPIESEGTYDLPEAQVDRFLFKLVVDYPAVEDEIAVVDRVSVEMPQRRAGRWTIEDLLELPAASRARCSPSARSSPTRSRWSTPRAIPARYGLADLEPLIQFGASPRASLGLVQAARALALLRGRTHALHHDVRDLAGRRAAPPARALLRRARRPRAARRADRPAARRGRARDARAPGGRGVTLDRPTRPPGPRAARQRGGGPARPRHRAPRRRPAARASAGRRASAPGTELAQLRPYEPGDDPRQLDPAASARTGVPHVRQHVPERALTTWIVLDLSASMAFGTGLRLKSDVAEGVASTIGQLAVRRGGRVAVVTAGAPETRDAAAALRPRRVRRRAAAGRRRRRPRRDAARAAAARGARARRAGLARTRGLVTVVSDFRDDGWHGAAARARPAPHRDRDRDRRPARGRAARRRPARRSSTPRPATLVEADTASPSTRAAFAAAEAERRAAVAEAIRRARAHHVTLSTDDDWLRELARVLR